MAVARGGSRLLGEACTTGHPYGYVHGDAAVATCDVQVKFKFKFKFSVEESGTVPC